MTVITICSDFVPRLGREPGGGHINPLQSSYLENPMDRGGWQATVPRAAKSWTWLKQLSRHTQHDKSELQTINTRVSVAKFGGIFLFVCFCSRGEEREQKYAIQHDLKFKLSWCGSKFDQCAWSVATFIFYL